MLTLLKYLHGNLVFLFPLGILLGIFLPGVKPLGEIFLVPSLMAVIFISCFRLESSEIGKTSLFKLVIFYLSRFLFLPILLWWITSLLAPNYSTAVLILSLAPAGVASVPFTYILRRKIATSFLLLVISSLAAPFVYPGITSLLDLPLASIEPVEMFQTLCIIVFLPIVLHLPLRRVAPLTQFMNKHGSVINVYLIALIILLATALQQEAFTFSSDFLLDLGILTLLYIIFYGFPYLFFRRSSLDTVSLAIVSGANNNALVIAIASLFYGALELLSLIHI